MKEGSPEFGEGLLNVVACIDRYYRAGETGEVARQLQTLLDAGSIGTMVESGSAVSTKPPT